MRLSDFIRSTSFRGALVVTGLFSVCAVLMFGFVYWQTAAYLNGQIDGLLDDKAASLLQSRPDSIPAAIGDYLSDDPRRIHLAGLFSADGHRIAGNLDRLPLSLKVNGMPRDVTALGGDGPVPVEQTIRAMELRLKDGTLLVIGRNIEALDQIAGIVSWALALGVIPTLALAVIVGIILSFRAEKRVEEVNRRVELIVAGNIEQRLPCGNQNDPFDRLAAIVNGMLDQIERLIREVSGVGDDIAHELRTPLTRVRATLERGRDNARTLDDFRGATDRALAGLDKSLAIVTALLRITDIEHRKRSAKFGATDLAGIMHEVAELYEPVAEGRSIVLQLDAPAAAAVHGDRELLFEAVINLVDNAVKFTPEGGKVTLSLLERDDERVVQIADTGPGIHEAERQAVTRRFYRSDKSRHTPGVGLGLSLVAAITSLHGFRLTIKSGRNCVVEIACPPAAVGPEAGSAKPVLDREIGRVPV